MKSVGEVMAIGRSIHESLQKALRGLETGLTGFDEVAALQGGVATRRLRRRCRIPGPDRLLIAAEALRQRVQRSSGSTRSRITNRGFSIASPRSLRRKAEVIGLTVCNDSTPSCLRRLKAMGPICRRYPRCDCILATGRATADRTPHSPVVADVNKIRRLGAMGFSGARLAALTGVPVAQVAAYSPCALGVHPVFKRIDTCAGEFAAKTPYMYSSYESPDLRRRRSARAEPTAARKVVILGGGPNRIGQGIEFDYCCVHACYALKRDAGFETIMINCNPETVSTDYDTSDRLYFEPLTAEDVLEVLQPRDRTRASSSASSSSSVGRHRSTSRRR